jgi:LPS sulfotransferase NodH
LRGPVFIWAGSFEMAGMDGYIICGTPRTGSTLLCDLLAAVPGAGAPDSFFMADPDPEWLRQWGFPERGTMDAADHAAACLDAAMRAGRGQGGLFGLRLMRRDLGALSEMIGLAHPGHDTDLARIRAAFGAVLFIHLTREDKLAQAVSMVRAEQTGLWHVAPDGTELERLAPPAEPVYDFGRIAAKLAELEAHDTAWRAWFAAEGVMPLTVGYAALSADPAAELARICEALGLPAPPPEHVRPGVARLADAVNRDWMQRFREEATPRPQP